MLATGRKLTLTASERERAIELADGITQAFAGAVAARDIAGLGSALPQRLVELVADRAARCRKLI